MKNGFQKLFVNQEMMLERPFDAFRQLLNAAIMTVVLISLSIFVLFHVFVTGLHYTAILNFIAVFIIASLLFGLYQTKEMGRKGHIMAFMVMVYFILFTYLNQAAEYGLIWGLFVPFVIITLTGLKAGLRYLLLFYVVIFSMAIWGLDAWDDKYWTQTSLVRFILASVISLLLTVVMDIANTGLNHQINKQRKKEKRYADELRRLSTVDALTELYNRHYFKEVLEKKLKELKGSDLYLTFFILDIDHFKLYNDEYGHYQGDDVLKQVATAVHNYIKRQDDLVFRLGGEEFGGLLVTNNPAETSEWISKLKDEVEALQILHSTKAPEKYVTISIGIFSAKVESLDTLNCIYRIADDALYQAKEQGRNQAQIILPLDEEGSCA